MLFADFKLSSGLITDLEYESTDTIELLSQEQHDTIYQLIHAETIDINMITVELVELMRMLILTPSVETICSKWLRITGNEKLFHICKNLGIYVDFQEDWLQTTDKKLIEQRVLLFRMREFSVSWNTRVLASNGYLDCLKYAHEQGCPWDKLATTNAASKGHLDCLKYAHEQGCPWTASATSRAASNGQLDCLKYLHEKGCPWNISTTRSAAANGQLDCLKYLHEQGCPWTRSTTYYATLNKHWNCLKYARENGCS